MPRGSIPRSGRASATRRAHARGTASRRTTSSTSSVSSRTRSQSRVRRMRASQSWRPPRCCTSSSRCRSRTPTRRRRAMSARSTLASSSSAKTLPEALVAPVCAAIRDHAFSKGVIPDALESKVLQDADRLDALGAIGLARMWATCADMKRPFYAPDEPIRSASHARPTTRAGGSITCSRSSSSCRSGSTCRPSRALAKDRVDFIHAFLTQLRSEKISGLTPRTGLCPLLIRQQR